MTQKSTRSTYEFHLFRRATAEARKATCPRKSVGCVIANNANVILSTGYNGAPDDQATCMNQGCIIEGGHCVRAVHAEIRAIAYAARSKVSLDGAIAYCTLLPCIQCMHALVVAGVTRIFYDETYDRDEKAILFHLAEFGGWSLLERIRE